MAMRKGLAVSAMHFQIGLPQCTLNLQARRPSLGRYIGYWKPYAGGHCDLDEDTTVQEEVRVVAHTLVSAVKLKRSGKFGFNGPKIQPPRQK